jgi:alpha-mannosidase
LLKLGGFKSFWFFRGVADWNTPSELLWEGIDGSRIPAFWLEHSYGYAYGAPNTLPEFTEFMKSHYDGLASFSRGRGRVALAGGDVTLPEEHVPALVEKFNAQKGMPFELRQAIPREFAEMVAKRPDQPVVNGELNPIFQGIYSSRIELKQRTRELESLLTADEKLGVLLHWLEVPADDEILWRGWEPMLFNQTHDLMSGVMTEHVYEDTIRGYDFSKRIAVDEFQSRMENLAAKIDTQGEGIPVAVFNMLGHKRTDLATVNVGFSNNNVMDMELIGPDGKTVPIQLIEEDRNSTGCFVRARIAFVARDVPAMGHAVYRLMPLSLTAGDPSAVTAKPQEELVIENNLYRIEFEPAGGAITRLLVKSGNWEALSGPANIVAREEDRGDLWEPYHTLDGASRIAMKDKHPAPQPGKGVFSSEKSGTKGVVTRGPVYSEFKVAHPFGENGKFATTVRVYTDLRRIDISTKLVNDEQFVRYRVLFPTSIGDGQSTHEIPFGAIKRPAGIEFPAQNWIDFGNEQKGITLLNRGLPGNNVCDGMMMLSLLRSTRIITYGDSGGGYGKGNDSSLELNKELTFDYSLIPHAGDWREAGVYRDGMEFNQPLTAYALATHPGPLPKQWGLLEISSSNVVISTLKSGTQGTSVLRIYEAAGKPAAAKIRLSAQVDSAEEVNLMEDPGSKLAVTGSALQFEMKPYEIKTIRLKLQPEKTAK